MKRNNQIIFIIITMFLNFLGFSIIIPVLPFLVQKYVTHPTDIALYVGLLMSIYALCQFLAAPGLGALSDRFGRKPILLLSLAGSVVGYIFLGIGGSIGILFIGRIIDGLTGGNISTVFAYIADITKPEERGKYYGILGAAGGFGFMFGPALGGFFATVSLSAPFYFAAAVTIFNIIWGYFVLSESLHAEHKSLKLDFNHLNPFKQFHYVFSVTILRKIFLITFIFFLALNGMQGISSVFYKDVFNWNPSQIGMVLFIVGLFDIISQGFLVTKLIPILGDTSVSKLGLVLTCFGFVIIACTSIIISPVLLYGGVIILIIGDGLFEPSINGIISKTVGPKMQGRVQGANQGMQSMARVVGPISAAWIYHYGKGLPYIAFSILIILSLAVLVISASDIKKHEAEYKFV